MVIDLTSDDAQDFDTTLDGVELNIKLDWNNRAQAWFMGAYDLSESPILTGIKLSVGESLLNHNKGKLPGGVLLLVRIDGELAAPRHDDLDEYFLEYLTLPEYVERFEDMLNEAQA